MKLRCVRKMKAEEETERKGMKSRKVDTSCYATRMVGIRSRVVHTASDIGSIK